VNDTIWNSPAINNSMTQNESWIFWNLTDKAVIGFGEIDTCVIKINGTNYPMNISGIYCYFNQTGLTNATTYCGNMTASDTVYEPDGQLQISTTQCQTINLTGEGGGDITPPDISWNSPSDNYVTQNSSFIFWNATLSEAGTCELDLNSSLNITMDVNGLYCSYNFSGTNTTTYCGRVYATDTYGNMNLSSSRCATINLSGADLVPPNITIVSPTAITYTTSDIALTVSANEAINTWWYSLNGGANASFTPNTTISGLASGVYTLNVYANDNYGNEGFSSATFTVQVPVISNLGFFAPIAGIAIGGGFLLFMLGLFFDEGAALARDPKKLATIAVGIVIVAVLLSALFV